MTYTKEYVLGFISLLPLLSASASKGLGWLVAVVMLYVGVPVLAWGLLVDRLGLVVLAIMLRFRESSGHQYYFEKSVGPPGFLRRILRDFRVLLFVFVLSALLVPQITEVTPTNVGLASTAFIYVAIFLLAIPSSIHVLLWVFEDSGLRVHNPSRITVTVPAAWMSKWLASLGSFGALASFAISLGGSLDRAVSLSLALLVSLLPSCILAPTLFYRRLESGMIAKIRQSKTATAMGRLFAPPYGPVMPPAPTPTR